VMEQFVALATGPLGALALSVGILWWLANRVLPVLTKYFDGHNEKLGQLVSALEKTVDAHEADRLLFTDSLKSLSSRVEKVEDTVSLIAKKIL